MNQASAIQILTIRKRKDYFLIIEKYKVLFLIRFAISWFGSLFVDNCASTTGRG